MVDQAEILAEFYKKNAKLWEEEVNNMSKKELQRLLKNMILYPLEQNALLAVKQTEANAFKTTMRMLDAKMNVLAYAMEQHAIKRKLSEGI